MKKLLFTIIIIGLSISSVAQSHSIGIQAGFNSSNISDEKSYMNSEPQLGFIGGLKYEMIISDRYSIGTDLLYNQQGFNKKLIYLDENGVTNNQQSNLRYSFNYLSLPIKFGYVFGGKFKIIPKIGIQPSLLLSSIGLAPEYDNTGNVIGEKEYDIKEMFLQFELSALAEIEFGYSLNEKFEIFTQLSSRYSLMSFSNPDAINYSDKRLYSYALSMGVKYKMNN